MTREELRDYVEEQRSQNNIPYHVYSTLIDGIDALEQEPVLDKIQEEIKRVDTVCHASNNHDELIRRNAVLQIIDKYKAEETEAHPINENIAKGFEEINKLIFENGQAESED